MAKKRRCSGRKLVSVAMLSLCAEAASHVAFSGVQRSRFAAEHTPAELENKTATGLRSVLCCGKPCCPLPGDPNPQGMGANLGGCQGACPAFPNSCVVQQGGSKICPGCAPGRTGGTWNGVVRLPCSACEPDPCTQCPPGKSSSSWFAESVQTCSDCETDTYNNSANDQCVSCPANSSAPALSSSPNACKCNAGYTGQDGVSCTACPAGKYKETEGSSQCTSCAKGKYSVVVAAIQDVCIGCSVNAYNNSYHTACVPCPTDANAPALSGSMSDCKCNAGYTGQDGVSCTACAAGKYKETEGSSQCSQCSPGKHSSALAVSDMAACLDCPRNTYSSMSNDMCHDCPRYAVSHAASSNISNCTCPPGYTGNSTCTACVIGKFKPINGSSSCTACEPGLISATASESEKDCREESPYLVDCGMWCVVEATGDERCYTTCGDGMQTDDEDCDDGNLEDGDGCSGNCTFEIAAKYKTQFNCSLTAVDLSEKLNTSGKEAQANREPVFTTPAPVSGKDGRWVWDEGRRAVDGKILPAVTPTPLLRRKLMADPSHSASCKVVECQLISIPEPGNSAADIAEAKLIGGTVSTIGFGVVALAFFTGAAAGPVFIMVDQMQYMSVIGRIGGGTSAANLALSESMGLFNFEFLPNIFEQESFKNPLGRRRDPQKLHEGHQDASFHDIISAGNLSLGLQFLGHAEGENGTLWSQGWLSTRWQRRQDGEGEELGMELEQQTEAEMADPGEQWWA